LEQAYNGALHERLSDIQRARIVMGMFDVSCERGGANVSVAHVVERAGVSRRTFYELFTDGEDCLLAAFEQALSYASERVLPAYESGKGWREKIRAGLIALLSFLDEEPVIGWFLIVASFNGGPSTLARRSEVVSKLVEAVEQVRTQAKAGATASSLTGEGLIGGALTVLHSRLAEKDHAPLIELTNPLMSMIVLPYLGAAVARKELDRPIPKPTVGRGKTTTLGTDPFKEAGMRLTHRTIRVLVVIADHPGASNRSVADAAEMTDQGQTSKLLSRLKRAGMITNTEPSRGKGAPNSWTLTASGQRIVATIRAHAEAHQPESHMR
jgi:AcrR family transcriptional regulator